MAYFIKLTAFSSVLTPILYGTLSAYLDIAFVRSTAQSFFNATTNNINDKSAADQSLQRFFVGYSAA
jgi:hypothetical protein